MDPISTKSARQGVPPGLFPPHVRRAEPYIPGGSADALRRRLGLQRIVKLASNEHFGGPTAPARDALIGAVAGAGRYPDGGADLLRHDLAARHQVEPEMVLVGAGADGCIDVLCQAILDRADELVCGWPSFPTYALSAAKLGAVSRRVSLVDHRHDVDAMRRSCGSRTKIVVVCSPNNPTGTASSRAEIERLIDGLPSPAVAIVDQAYFEYVGTETDHFDAVDYVRAGLPVIAIRTFSKIHGLAGARVGYAVAAPEIVARARSIQRAFDVAGLAQDAARASLAAVEEIRARGSCNATLRAALWAMLERAELDPVESSANFVYCRPRPSDGDVAGALMARGVLVRELSGFGAPGAIRVSVGTEDEHAILQKALDEVLAR